MFLRLLRAQSLEWFYNNVKSRFKRFGSAKVLKNLYRKHRLESGACSDVPGTWLPAARGVLGQLGGRRQALAGRPVCWAHSPGTRRFLRTWLWGDRRKICGPAPQIRRRSESLGRMEEEGGGQRVSATRRYFHSESSEVRASCSSPRSGLKHWGVVSARLCRQAGHSGGPPSLLPRPVFLPAPGMAL